MPKIPVKYRRTSFPEQMWEVTPKQNHFFFEPEIPGDGMRVNLATARTRAKNKAALNRMFGNNLSKAMPVYGPEMPVELERQRIAMKPFMDAYNEALAEENARQAYNRKVTGWDSYRQLPRKERQFWANKDAIEDYLYNMGYATAPMARLATRNPESLDRWAKANWDMGEYPYGDAEEFESFDEFPEVTAPWLLPWRK